MPILDERLGMLSGMSPTQLRHEWERAYRTPAPSISPELLKLGIAYRLQEKELGGLSRTSTTALKAPPERGRVNITIKPGTRLVRGWNGRTISVQVAEDGYLYEDRVYGSLSAIAREVTGTNWSGPRFFGLDGSVSHD